MILYPYMNETAILSKLVKFRSITSDPDTNAELLEYVAAFLKERGLICRIYEFKGYPALVAWSTTCDPLKAKVMLAAHADVAEAGEDMFTLREENGRLLGRGVYDMKFAIAAYMKLVDELGERVSDYDFAIMITTDEEFGSRDGINGTKDLVEMGYRPKVCILPDSTAAGWDVEKLAKGYWRFDLEAFGRTAHGAKPWEGESASFKLVPALAELENHFKNQNPDTDTINIAAIHGGEAYNQQPADMISRIEVRFLSEESLRPIKKLVNDLVGRYKLSYRERVLSVPAVTDLGDPLVEAFIESVKEVTGHKAKGIVSHAGTDAEYFNEVNIPCVISCPLGGGHHSENEWLDKKSFLQFVPILHDYLNRVASLNRHATVTNDSA
jgi:succinyl-diaminopimelate desuccinylase